MKLHANRSNHFTKQNTKCLPCNKENQSEETATYIANDYCRRVPEPFQYGTMGAYRCKVSKKWHTGHAGKKRAIDAVKKRMWG